MAETPIVFTRDDDTGKTLERTAHTAAEAVKLRFDGWREKRAGGGRDAKTSSDDAKTK